MQRAMLALAALLALSGAQARAGVDAPQKSSLVAVKEAHGEVLEVRMPIVDSMKDAFVANPVEVTRKWLQSQGEVVNGLDLSPDLVKEAVAAVKASKKGSPAMLMATVAHVDFPPKYKSLHVNVGKLHVAAGKPGITKVKDGKIELYEATVALNDKERATYAKDPVAGMRHFLESQRQKVNGIIATQDFLDEAAKLATVKGGTVMQTRIWVHIGSPWYYWSWWARLK